MVTGEDFKNVEDFIKYIITGPGMLSGYSAPGNCDFDPIFGD